MAVTQTAAEAMLWRLPIVRIALDWFRPATFMVVRLDVTSQQLFARIARVIWRVLQTHVEKDVTQPVSEQIELGHIVAVLRFWSMFYARFYTSSNGSSQLSLTQQGSDALSLLEHYDPLFQGTAGFDLDDALERVIRGTRMS